LELQSRSSLPASPVLLPMLSNTDSLIR
jgi:hypothetical protein